MIINKYGKSSGEKKSGSVLAPLYLCLFLLDGKGRVRDEVMREPSGLVGKFSLWSKRYMQSFR